MANYLNLTDPELASLLDAELKRQNQSISLIASENLTSHSILEINGSILTNKVVEGYPDNRYHGGCQYIDEIENLAIQRACKLFKADHANVQPHSGVNANLAVMAAVLKPGDKILSMSLSHGGHLSHGAKANITGAQLYNIVHYGVDPENQLLDYNNINKLAEEHKPEMIIAGFSAYPKSVDFINFKKIADRIGSYLLVDIAHIAGLVATELHPSPVPYSDFVTGTCYKTLRGGKGGFILCKEKYKEKIDKAVFPGTQGTANIPLLAAKAFSFREAQSPVFKKYCQTIISNARELAKSFQNHNLKLIGGGTDTHQVLIDLRSIKISGSEAEKILAEVGIETNKNLIPFDPTSPKITSGLRLGTTTVTSRGMTEKDMKLLANLITKILLNSDDSKIKIEVKNNVKNLTEKYPIYLNPWIEI